MTEACGAITSTKTTCPYCGVGCGVVVRTQEIEDAHKPGKKAIQIIDVTGDPDHPANYGRLCSKGSKLAETARSKVYAQVRLDKPKMRVSREAELSDATWGDALDHVARQYAKTISEHGPDSVAFYISGQLLTEDYYAFNKLAKGLIGTNNVDTNSRLCMSSAVSGYKRTLGADAPPACYEDLDHAQCILIAGSNMAYAHPVAFRRLEAARAGNPNQKIIVIDPRVTDTAAMADLHLPIQPGTDVMLFNGMLNVIIQNGLLDMPFISKHTEGLESMAKGVEQYSPEVVASVCGVAADDVVKAALWFAQSPASLSLYCQGLNQATTGTDKNTALIALHLATGHIGRAGAGPFSLTGQPNAMGGREVGGLATLLSAHRDLNNPQHVAEMQAFWNVKRVSATPGATAVELFDSLEKGTIKAVWIACTNPAHSLPNSKKVARALQQAELVIVQDAYQTPETVRYADVLLPATTWGEKEGTVTNSERCITRVRPAMPKYRESRHDWEIVVDFAQRLERELLALGVETNRNDQSSAQSSAPFMAWESAEAIFNEHRESTRGRDLDITGLSYDVLDTLGPQQWPMPEGAPKGKARLYEDGVFSTASGKAKFIFAEFVPVAEDADARFPFRLNTGRLRDQWHGCSRTGTLPEFFSHEAEPRVSMNPKDMLRLKLTEHSWVMVKSRRAEIIVQVQADESVAYNQCVFPMHWGPEYLGGLAGISGVNALTIEAFDPYSKQPELKHSAVRIEPVSLPWQCVVFVKSTEWLALWSQVRGFYREFDVALSVSIGRGDSGVLFRCAHRETPPAELIARLETLFGVDAGPVLKYSDPQTGAMRRIALTLEEQGGEVKSARINKVFLAGDIQSEGWLRNYFDSQEDVLPLRAWLLAPSSQPPGVSTATRKMICNCVGVSDAEIEGVVVTACAANPSTSEEEVLQGLKTGLRCGTQCGSCVPEVRKMIRVHQKPTKSTGLATIS